MTVNDVVTAKGNGPLPLLLTVAIWKEYLPRDLISEKVCLSVAPLEMVTSVHPLSGAGYSDAVSVVGRYLMTYPVAPLTRPQVRVTFGATLDGALMLCGEANVPPIPVQEALHGPGPLEL